MPKLLLTRIPQEEGASIGGGDKKERRRKLSGGEELLKGFLLVHEACAAHGATPRRYMAFLHAYMHVYGKKKSGIETRQQHLQVCLHSA